MQSLSIPLKAYVVDRELRTTKSGDLFLQLNLKTIHGTIRANMWDVPLDVSENKNYPVVADLLDIYSFTDQREKHQNIVIRDFAKIKFEQLSDNESAVLLKGLYASKEEMATAKNLIRNPKNWQDENHFRFVMNCLDALDQTKLERCAGAIHHHHKYVGGLLVHTAEVLELCLAYIPIAQRRYSFISPDVLLAGAILHDIGKTVTYSSNEAGVSKITTEGIMSSHLYYGMHHVQNVYEGQWKGLIEPEFVNEVLHCIAAHHENPEWGTIVKPQSIEALVLCKMDYISSRNSTLEEMLASAPPTFEELKSRGDERYFASLGIKSYLSTK